MVQRSQGSKGPTSSPTSHAEIKPEIFVNFRREPDLKNPARLTTLLPSEYLYTINRSIQFTKEIEASGSLAFLDVFLRSEAYGSFSTNV